MKRKKYESLKDEYPEYVSLDQMYQICGIAKRSALYLIKNGIVPALDTGKQTWRYKIALDDVITYLRRKEQWGSMIPPGLMSSRLTGNYGAEKKKPSRKCYADIISSASESELVEFFIYIYEDYPDMLTTKEASEMTGFSVKSICYLITSGDIEAIFHSSQYLIPKESLLSFVTSKKYCDSRCNSPQFQKVLSAFEIWLSKRRDSQ